MRTTSATFIFVLLLPRLLAADVSITRTEPVIERRTFDPRKPPQDMPKLHPNEAAVTQSFFGADTRVGGVVTERNTTAGDEHRVLIKIDTVKMTLKLRVTIWLPDDAVAKLVKHEEGHREIAEHYYRDAESLARKLAEELVGQTVSGAGKDDQSAGDNGLEETAQVLGGKYLGQTDVPSGKAQELYDRITAHGTNPVKEERAIKESIQRVAEEQARK